MSFTNIPIPENLLGTVGKLVELSQAEPIVAEHVVPIVEELFGFAMGSGRITDPDVWVRAFKAAAEFVEVKKADDTWLSAEPVQGPLKPE